MAVEAIAAERGFTGLHLSVDTDNIQAISFYEKTGWHKSVEPSGVWNGHMIKSLFGNYE
jgi:ribosomal protein S18 acetylase RimI-like enzyme